MRRRPPPPRCAGALDRRGAACTDLLPDTEPPPVRPRASGASPRAAAGGVGGPHRVPHPAPQPTPSQTSRSGALGRAESRAKGGERRSPHPRPPTERTGPARAPRSASRIPPSKIWNRWRGAALTRTSFGGSFVCRAPSMGRTTTHHRTPAERIGGPRGASHRPSQIPPLQKVERWEKRAADARTHPTPSPSATTPFYWVPCPGNVSTVLARGGRRRFPTHGTAAPPHAERTAGACPPPRR